MRKILIAAATVMLTAGAPMFGASAEEKLKVDSSIWGRSAISVGPISMTSHARPW